ncbi:unnamed protein product [Rotaria magnacalcarata]|uniref:WD repeat-containing protein 11 n=9 Tax=Rotaria magnacalcarata TaxID=392030 RepID=A0A819ANF0_9BILA|nr:unnamed protein product [Rotaria magnacalcarata]CAF3826002.1 unnamed protein product [Rotaria magnacalcarata]
MNLIPRIIPGALNNANKDAIDWNHHGHLAYGCQSTIVVLDSQSFRVLQCMEKYHDLITKVKWFPDYFYHNLEDSYSLKLASADSNGNILIWDVYKSSVQCEFRDGNKPITDMLWYACDNNPQLLLVVHSPNIVILWNTQTGTKIWRIVYDQERQKDVETFQQIIQDPFNHQRAILLGQSSLAFIEDFSPINTPSGQNRRFYISNTNNNNNNNGNKANPSSNNNGRTPSISSTSSQLTTRLKTIIEGTEHSKQDDQSSSSVVSLNDCIQILFHPMHRHLILIVYPREILIFDLQILQTVGTISCEKHSAAFYKIYGCRRRDTFICFHESGTISVRNRHLENSTITALQSANCLLHDFVIDLTYDLTYYSDPFRLVKNTRICSFSVSPKDESSISVILTDGKVLFWNVDQKPLSTSSHGETYTEGNIGNRIPLGGVMFAAPTGPYVLSMCPPMTVKNYKEWQPLLAVGNETTKFFNKILLFQQLYVGCTNGDIVVFNLNDGTIQRQLAVHSCAVRGLLWLNSQLILSWAYQTPSDGRSTVRNEIFMIHFQSGRQEAFRSEINFDESPIESLKASHIKNYLIILFRDQPFELWDLKSFTIIRRLPKKCPRILALDWSPNVSVMKKTTGETNPLVATKVHTSAESEYDPNRTTAEPENVSNDFEKKLSRENFIFTDEYNLLYHFYVEGRTIKEVATVPPDHSSSMATDLVLKGDYLLSGDVEGIIKIFNIKLKQSKTFNTKRSPIRKVRFAPGKGNFRAFVLFNDGVDIWDVRDRDRISTLKFPRDTIQVTDGDWASSDKIILACSDHCLRIYEMSLVDSSSSLEFQTIPQSTLYPYVIPGRHANLLKHLLCISNGSIDALIAKCEDTNLQGLLEKELAKLDADSRTYLTNTTSTIDRCLFIANLFNDPWEQSFWRLTEYYLYVYGTLNENSNRSSLPLLSTYDLLLDAKTFEQIQLERTIRRDIKSISSSASINQCIDSYIALQQVDRAVQLLLDTDPADDTYAINCIKACLISSMQKQANETPKNTVTKLVATNLIANGKVDEGVQLLCTIDLCAEACRYLQDHNQWERSIWLAKLRLKPNSNEYIDVIKRWSEYVRLHSPTSKMNSALILISCGQFRRAIEVLHNQGATELAIRLFVCCKQFSVDDGTIGEKLFDDYTDLMRSFSFTSIANDYRTTIVV